MKKWNILLLMTILASGAVAQSKDTTAMVREFTKVMSFAVQPYLYYTTLTKIDAVPVVQALDTMSQRGVFYKNGDNLYYQSGEEEVFLEDSLLVQIDMGRKTIWISRVDMESRDNINIVPLNNKKLQELFRKNYTISRATINDKTARMNFESKRAEGQADFTTRIGLEYMAETHLPVTLDMELRIQQPASEEMLGALAAEGMDEKQWVVNIDNLKYIVRKQRVSISFMGIDNSKEKAGQMPGWKSRLAYDADNASFSGKGIYGEYEITKTF